MSCIGYSSFSIVCDERLDMSDLTNILKIKPTNLWKKNDTSSHGITRKDSCWSFETGYIPIINVDELLTDIYNIFSKKSTEIVKYINSNNNISTCLNIVIKMNNKETPGFTINNNTISFLNKVGAEIDVDMYIV